MSNRRVRIKRVLSDVEELVDLNDGIGQAIDVVSRNTEIPFGLPQTNVIGDIIAKTGGVYVLTPGYGNIAKVTLQNITVADQGKTIIIRNEDAYDMDSYVGVYPQADDKTINGAPYITLTAGQSAMFMPRSDLNWNMFPFTASVLDYTDSRFIVKVSTHDIEPNYLYSKLVAGAGVSITKLSAANVETVRFSVPSCPPPNDGYIASATLYTRDGYYGYIPQNTYVSSADVPIGEMTWEGYGVHGPISTGYGTITIDMDGYYVIAPNAFIRALATIVPYGGGHSEVSVMKNGVPLEEFKVKSTWGNANLRGVPVVVFLEVSDVISYGFLGNAPDNYPTSYNVMYISVGGAGIPSVGGLHIHRIGSVSATNIVPSIQSYKSMISADDSTPNWLEDKVVGGNRITVSTLNPAADEDLQIAMDAHAADHQQGGGDTIKLDDLRTPDDNTDLDSTTTEHGLLRKLDNDDSHYLDGQGNWSEPPGTPDLDAYATMDWVEDGYAPLADFNNHSARHENGGADEISVDGLSGQLAEWQPPSPHHLWHENGGGDDILVTGLSGLLADDQNPVNHAADHQQGGGDTIKLDDLRTPDDNTDLNATTSEHGLLRRLDNNPGRYLNGQGNWVKPKLDDLDTPDDNTDLNSTTTEHGLLPKLDNDGDHYLDGEGNWTRPLADGYTPLIDFNDHSGRHENGGADEINVSNLSGLLADQQNPKQHHTSHESGWHDEISVTGLTGLLGQRQYPVNHAADHQAAGSDAIKLDDLRTPDDNTDLDSTTSRHGLLKKLDNDATHYLDGQGGWTVPSGAPIAHASSHENGGGDEISVAGLSGELADNQPPKTHAADHQSGGGDAIKLDDLATPDDNTDLNATTSKHGLLRKLDNDDTHFLDGQGNWAVPSGAQDLDAYATMDWVEDGYVDQATFNNHNTRHESGGADAIKLDDLATPDDNTDLDATTSEHGLLPKLDNIATHFLDGKGNWAIPGGGGGGADSYQVMVSVDDSTVDYLEGKIIGGGLIDVSVDDPGGDESLVIGVDLDGYAAPDLDAYAQAYIATDSERLERTTTGIVADNTPYQLSFENSVADRGSKDISVASDGTFTFAVAGTYRISLGALFKSPTDDAGRFYIRWKNVTQASVAGGTFYASHSGYITAGTYTGNSFEWVDYMAASDTGHLIVYRKNTTDTTFDMACAHVYIERIGD